MGLSSEFQFISKTLILRAKYLHLVIGMFCFALHGTDGFPVISSDLSLACEQALF